MVKRDHKVAEDWHERWVRHSDLADLALLPPGHCIKTILINARCRFLIPENGEVTFLDP